MLHLLVELTNVDPVKLADGTTVWARYGVGRSNRFEATEIELEEPSS